MRISVPLCFFLLLLGCSMTVVRTERINGVSFVASGKNISQEHVVPVVEVNANYAAVMPFGYVRSLDSPDVLFDMPGQWIGETSEGVDQYVNELRKKNIKIMLKPHIWVWGGGFTGRISMTNEADWLRLESKYRDFILAFARQAEKLSLEMFCIGTELEDFIVARPEYWNALIADIRSVYSGELTYAANWDEYKRVPFWWRLDYIGIDAYFPLTDTKTPTIEQAREGWQQHKPLIEEVSVSHDLPVMFTEFGYRSVDYAGKEPWKSDRSMNGVNLEAQSNLTQALFDEFWDEPWFAGGFVWKWHLDHNKVGGSENFMFTPQNKPAEAVIKSAYRKD